MTLDLPSLTAAVARHGVVVRVLVVSTAGSVPREAGTSMLVWAGGEAGTIGGGELENRAVAEARGLLGGGGPVRRTVPLGPALGQCCGGSVVLAWERFDAASLPPALPFARAIGPVRGPAPAAGTVPVLQDGWLVEAGVPPGAPLWVWGAGHVGRAVVAVMAPFPDRAVTWVDVAPDRFPDPVPPGVVAVPTAEPALLAAHAPVAADHLVMTRSHELDLLICHALLLRGFGSLGLIGSLTKRARFARRLGDLGHPAAQISRIACPIGDPGLGRHPQAIAVGVAAALLRASGRGERGATG